MKCRIEWQPGSIERRYTGCADDMDAGANNTQKTGDLCWDTDNASLSLWGHAGELLKDGANPSLWHLRNDDVLSDNWISPPTTITSPHFEA